MPAGKEAGGKQGVEPVARDLAISIGEWSFLLGVGGGGVGVCWGGLVC